MYKRQDVEQAYSEQQFDSMYEFDGPVMMESQKTKYKSNKQQVPKIIHSSMSKTITFTQTKSMYLFYGKFSTCKYKSSLLRLFRCSQIPRKHFQRYLLVEDHPYQYFRYTVSDRGPDYNKYLRKNLNYFKDKSQRWQYLQRKMRIIFTDFRFPQIIAFSFLIFGNQYKQRKDLLKQLDFKFKDQLGGYKLENILSGEDILDMSQYYQPIVKDVKAYWKRIFDNLDKTKIKQYQNMWEDQKKHRLYIPIRINQKQDFQIGQSETFKHQSFEQKTRLLLHFIKEFKALIGGRNDRSQLDEDYEVYYQQVPRLIQLNQVDDMQDQYSTSRIFNFNKNDQNSSNLQIVSEDSQPYQQRFDWLDDNPKLMDWATRQQDNDKELINHFQTDRKEEKLKENTKLIPRRDLNAL